MGTAARDLLHVPHARAHDAPASLVPRRLAAPPPAAFRTPRTCTHRWRCFAPWERRTQVTVIRCMCHTGVCALPEPRPAQFGSSCSLTPRTATGERCERCPEMSSHLCVPVSAERDVEFACRKLLKMRYCVTADHLLYHRARARCTHALEAYMPRLHSRVSRFMQHPMMIGACACAISRIIVQLNYS